VGHGSIGVLQANVSLAFQRICVMGQSFVSVYRHVKMPQKSKEKKKEIKVEMNCLFDQLFLVCRSLRVTTLACLPLGISRMFKTYPE